MLIYLAHPIDQAQSFSSQSVAVHCIADLLQAGSQQGHTFYRPAAAFFLPEVHKDHDDMTTLDRVNQSALFECNGMIAIIPPSVPTLGTPAEIEKSLMLNRATCIITTESLRKTSVQIAAWASRGARVVLMSEQGRIHNLNLADALGSLPDPMRIFEESAEMVGGAPPLLVTRKSSNAKIPTRAYRGDAGLDLAVVGEHDIKPGEYVMLPTGIKAAVPNGYWGFMTGRSSAWKDYQFDIRQAVIDSGYRGELMIGVHNRGSELRTVFTGTRLAQYVLLPAFLGDVTEVDDLPDHERGENGYGSSGK